MTAAAFARRLARLEATTPLLRRRYVWMEQDEPIPVAEPGEELIVLRWASRENDATAATILGSTAAPLVEAEAKLRREPW